MTIERQFALTEEINAFIRELPDFQEALAEDQLIALDTGDGHALIFLGDPQQAGNVGLAIAEHSRNQHEHKIRVGLNSGPITIRTDLMGNPNATGPGIDMAARIQSLAEADTLYMTKAAAEQLIAFDAWRTRLVDMGTRLVKHEQAVHVYAAGPVSRSVDSGRRPGMGEINAGRGESMLAAKSTLSRIVNWPWTYVLVAVVALAIALPQISSSNGDWTNWTRVDFADAGFTMGSIDQRNGWYCDEAAYCTIAEVNGRRVLVVKGRPARGDGKGNDGFSGAHLGLLPVSASVAEVRLRFQMKIAAPIESIPGRDVWYSFALPSTPEGPAWFEYRRIGGRTVWRLVCNGETIEFVRRPPLTPTDIEVLWDVQAGSMQVRVDGEASAELRTVAGAKVQLDRLSFINAGPGLPDGVTLPDLEISSISLDYRPRK